MAKALSSISTTKGRGQKGRKENTRSHLDSKDNKTETAQKRFARLPDKRGSNGQDPGPPTPKHPSGHLVSSL